MAEWVVIDRVNVLTRTMTRISTGQEPCPSLRIRRHNPPNPATFPKAQPFMVPPMVFPTFESARLHVAAIVDDWCRNHQRAQTDYNLTR